MTTSSIADPKVVIGPGTGLGIANLVYVNDNWSILSGEGGHVDLRAHGLRVKSRFGRISTGLMAVLAPSWPYRARDLENLYQAICSADAIQAEQKNSSGNLGFSN